MCESTSGFCKFVFLKHCKNLPPMWACGLLPDVSLVELIQPLRTGLVVHIQATFAGPDADTDVFLFVRPLLVQAWQKWAKNKVTWRDLSGKGHETGPRNEEAGVMLQTWILCVMFTWFRMNCCDGGRSRLLHLQRRCWGVWDGYTRVAFNPFIREDPPQWRLCSHDNPTTIHSKHYNVICHL